MAGSTPDREGEPDDAARIKVTDKRRVRPDGEDAASAQDAASRPPVVDAGERPVVGVAEPVDTSAAELAEAKKQAADYLDRLQRLTADFDNARKRMLKDQTRAVEMASEAIVARMLEVLDEFQLALMAAEQKPDFDRFLHGVELVYAKLLDILRAEGLERIQAKGRPFDPMRHEALMQSGDDDGSGEPVVADVLREGYTLKGRVLRPAGVKVSHRGASEQG
jgi:molecular chaperone GrpE